MTELQIFWKGVATALGALILFGSAAGVIYTFLGYGSKYALWKRKNNEVDEHKRKILEIAPTLIETPQLRKTHTQRFEDIDARLERISFNLEQYVKMQDKIVENAHKQEKQLKFMVEERQLILQMLKPMIQLCVEIGSKDTSTAALDAQEALHTYYTKRAQEFV